MDLNHRWKSAMFFVLFLAIQFRSAAQVDSLLSLGVTPGGQIPFGPSTTEGLQVYTAGVSANLSIDWSMPFARGLFARGLLGYTGMPTIVETNLSLVGLGIGAGWRFPLLPRLEAQLAGAGGYSACIYPGSTAWGTAFASADASFLFSLGNSFALGLGASYNWYSGVYNGLGIFLGAVFRPQIGPVKTRMEMSELRFDPVFPVFYKYYDDHAIGRIVLRNGENGTIHDVKVSLFVEQYMTQPKECAVIGEMAKGAQEEADLFALFKDDILRITEDTKVPAQIQVSYAYLDSRLKAEMTQTLRIHHRNAMTWDDDRKVASFVNAKDPLLLQFAKGVTGEVRNKGASVINRPLREAMGLFDALKVYGVNYVVDPSSSYSANSTNESVVDFLQFPVQTLVYKAGDCDDLSILLAALLEAVGTETAFVTVPGHIFMAFNTGLSAEEAAKSFQSPADLVLRDGKAWIPVEVTMVQDGFLRAWAEGAKEWRENAPQGKANFFPVHDAWKIYEPVAGSDPGTRLEMPALQAVVKEYQAELARYIQREIKDQEADLLAKIKASGGDAKSTNRLGVLYARYGMFDQAAAQFRKAAATGNAPAMVNLGNIAMLQNEAKAALAWYAQASAKDTANVGAVEGLAKANFALENYGVVKELYEKLQGLNPEEAKKVAWLVGGKEEGNRAAEAGDTGGYFWAE